MQDLFSQQADLGSSEAIRELERVNAVMAVDKARPGRPVVGIALNGRLVTDRTARYLMDFPLLEKLSLSNSRVTDAGIAVVEKLTHLRELSLADSPITDTGIGHLKGLNNLVSLNLIASCAANESFLVSGSLTLYE
jgi:hypothetical protein